LKGRLTSRKKAFIFGSHRPLSSGLKSTLIQEMLKMTSVKQPTSRCQQPRRLFDENRRCIVTPPRRLFG